MQEDSLRKTPKWEKILKTLLLLETKGNEALYEQTLMKEKQS